MGDRGVNIHRTGETGRRRFPEEDGRKNRRRIRNNIIIDDAAQPEDLLDRHSGIIEERLDPVVIQEKKKQSDEKLVDNFLVSIFGASAKEALERQDFIHSQNGGVSEAILALSLNKEAEHPELKIELEKLETDAQEQLKALDQSSEFSREKLRELLNKYKQDLNSLDSNNNMSKEEQVTPPLAERVESPEVSSESPAEVAAETVEQIDQQAATAVTQVPEIAPEIKKIATDSRNEVQQVVQGRKLEPIDYAENELDKIGKPKSKVEINAESPEAGSKIDKIKSLIKKLNDTFSAAGVEGYAARRKSLQEADDLIGTKQYQDIVLSHSKDKDKELLMNEAIERAVKELEDMLRNEEVRVKNLEKLKEIKSLRDLIQRLEASFGASDVDGYDARKKALQEAARILGNDVYLVILNRDKDGGMSVNEAIEKAILEAETRLRALEVGDNTEKAKVSAEEVVAAGLATEKVPVDIDRLVKESAVAVEADPNVQEARRRLDGNGLETKAAESDPELAKKRVDFWTELHKRGNVWSIGRFLGILKQNQGKLDDFEKIRAEYSDAQAKELEAKLKVFVAGLDPKLSEVDKNFAFTQEYVRLKKAEDEEVDTVVKGLGIRGMDKFKAKWKRTALKRGAFGAGLWALGAVTGGMGFLAGKVGLSSLGAYMTAESVLDTRTKTLGQKSLIDKLKNTGFKRGEKAKITEEDKTKAIEALMADEYSVEDLEKEWSHLRVLSLDKNKGIKEAGRFGAEQAPLVEAVQEVYYYKKAQQLAAELSAGENPEIAKAVSLASFLTSENNATQVATSEQDKSRMKAIARNVTAVGIGLTVGWLASQKILDAVDHTPEVVPQAPLPVEEIPPVEIPDGLIGKGDTVWGMVEDHLSKIPGWDKLNPAEQTRYIDYFENKIVDDPSAFGLTDPDHLQPGTKIHWGDLFADKNLDEGMKFVKTLTPEQMQNIVENNKILSEAAKHGVEITSKNVDTIIHDIRVNGLEQYLAEHGHGAAQAVAENTQDIAAGIANGAEASDAIDTATEAASGAADSPAVEALEQTVSDGKVEGFLTGARAYAGDIYESIQSYAETNLEHAHEQMSALVNKVFESSAQVQQDFLQDLNPTDFTEGNNKAEVFLKMIQESGNKLSEIDSADKLKGLISSFDHLAHNPELPVGKAFEPRLIFGEDGSEAYVFIKSAGKKVLGLFGEKQYVIDGLSGTTKTVTEEIAKTLLNHNNVA